MTSAFLFARDSFFKQGRQHYRLFGRSPDGQLIQIIIDQDRPCFFIPESHIAQLQNFSKNNLPLLDQRALQLKNPDSQPVCALYFRSQFDLRKAAATLRAANIPLFESDVDPLERYMMERFITGGIHIESLSISQPEKDNSLNQHPESPLIFHNPQMKPALVDAAMRIVSLDIETSVSSGRLLSIGLHDPGQPSKEKIVFMLGDRTLAIQDTGKVSVIACGSEENLLQQFVNWMQSTDPDIIIGWNVIGFDFRFLIERSRKLHITLAMGRDGSLPRFIERQGMADRLQMIGRLVLDGPTLMRGAYYSFDDFRLDTVAHALLGRGKVIEKTNDKAAEIERMFHENPVDFVKYNIADAELVSEIFAKTELIAHYKARAENSGMPMDRTARSVASFDFHILPRLHRHGYVARDLADIQAGNPAKGGYVMEPVVGLHKNVAVLDFRSLYPSIIRTFKIDPLSLIENSLNPLSTPDGHKFSRTNHILPDLIGDLLDKRTQAKKSNDGHLSQAIKILMNSFYGVMGSPGCRFYHPDLPSAITGTGQWILRQSRQMLEELGYRVLYGDTDSLFIAMDQSQSQDDSTRNSIPEPISENELASIQAKAHALATELSAAWQERIKNEFQLKSFLELEFEKLFMAFFLPPARMGGGARKRYVGLLKSNKVEELYFAGMESVRSDWSELARSFQKELYWRVFHGTEIVAWIRAEIAELRAGNRNEMLAIKKQIRKPLHEYTTNVPQHIQAARLLQKTGRYVRYVLTYAGPVPLELNPTDFDFNYYIEKQIAPIADTVLWIFSTSLDEILHGQQIDLFGDL